jgi:three-Cys-motif partner protein
MKTPSYQDREQTEVKHRTLERYLSACIPIVGSWAADIAYIDCLAGPWKANSQDLTDTSFAKAIATLRQAKPELARRGKFPTMRCLLIENDPSAFTELQEFARSVEDIEVVPHFWDFSKHIADVVKFANEKSNSFPFIFIDPTGWELAAIDLIAPILRLRRGEVLINLMTSWIRRFLTDETKNFHRLVGDQVQKLRSLSGDEQEEELVRIYASEIKRAGQFNYVCTLPVMKSDQDSFHFHLVYATRHVRGVEEFKKTEKHIIPFMHATRAEAQQRKSFNATKGQYSLLQPEETYSERRFTRLNAKNLDLAHSDVLNALKKNGTVPYDDLWGIAMQYSTVLESDFKSWVREWLERKQAVIRDPDPKQKFPKRHSHQDLQWKGEQNVKGR